MGQVGGRASMAAMPVQRGNYGIPARQMAPARPFNDIAPPQQSAPAPMQPVMQPVPPVQPIQPPAPTYAQPAPAVPVQQPQPMAAPAPQPIQTPQQPIFQTPVAPVQAAPIKKQGFWPKLIPKLQLVLIIVGVLLTIGGVARLMTAPNIAANTIAVGAVSANDGSNITIQFTADDGKLHKLKQSGNFPKLIPGTAVQIAYQPGAPDTTAKQVDSVKAVKNQGTALAVAGGSLLTVGLIIWFVRFIRRRADGPRKVAMATTA